MSKFIDYTKLINRFGSKIEKMLGEDFGNEAISLEVQSHIATIQYKIIEAFLGAGKGNS